MFIGKQERIHIYALLSPHDTLEHDCQHKLTYIRLFLLSSPQIIYTEEPPRHTTALATPIRHVLHPSPASNGNGIVRHIRRLPRPELNRKRGSLPRRPDRIQNRSTQNHMSGVPVPLARVRETSLLQRGEVSRPVIDQDAAVGLDGLDSSRTSLARPRHGDQQIRRRGRERGARGAQNGGRVLDRGDGEGGAG
jgi:hypothetical protein